MPPASELNRRSNAGTCATDTCAHLRVMIQWAPITIRSELAGGSTSSGVYLVNGTKEIAVTLSTRVEGKHASGTLHTSMKEVVWEDLALLSSVEMNDVLSELRSLGGNFNFPEPRLLVFEFVNKSRVFTRQHGLELREYVLDMPEPGQIVRITSSPFASAHTALFHGYVSTGVISRVFPSLVLVDARYLDGMNGGIVNFEQLSVGLVLGALVKENGEGRLMAVVPWQSIITALPDEFRVPVGPLLPSATWKGVVSVLIRKGRTISWGSGVLVANNTVVSNNHVVKGYAADSVEIWASGNHRVAAKITRPHAELDLVLIKLDRPVPLKPVKLAAHDAPAESKVHSVGFGLFLPRAETPPLESKGVVSRKIEGMLITSAGCWNGSSGGGLFNERNELVGIMASNARDNVTGEIMTDLSMSIPVSVLRRAIDAQPLSEEVAQAWTLQPSYKEIRAKL